MASIQQLCKTGILLNKGRIQNTGQVDDIVNEYLTSNIKEVGDVDLVCDKELHRLGPTTKEIEILSVKRCSPYHMDSLDSLGLQIRVRRNNSSTKNFQFTVLIDNVAVGGTRVGIALSNEILWDSKEDTAEFNIQIPEHHLAKGKYILDVWTNSGDVLSSYKYYDCVYDTITFEVGTMDYKPISEWHNYWGESIWQMNVQ